MGLSVAATAVVSTATWLGTKDKKWAAISAVATLSIAFIAQK
jgi:hypothetical protein